MGYLTTYSLEYSGPVVDEAEIINALAEINPRYFNRGVRDIDAFFCETIKWYDHDEDMLELSERFPNHTFTLEGIGEEFPDFWRNYYYRGKMKESLGRIFYDPVDLSNWED